MKIYKPIEVNLYNELMSLYQAKFKTDSEPPTASNTQGTQTGGAETARTLKNTTEAPPEAGRKFSKEPKQGTAANSDYWTTFEKVVEQIKKRKNPKRRR